ncbi:type VI secretion system contractile sheath large subunit [Myxococcota bacterium]|nr:type VI secretion system contractile sheath large subunit [Myxococcota bacterium]
MLSYRTNITGTPLSEQLPFRVLVLGQFSGSTARDLNIIPDLDQRPIRSIQLDTTGASADDYLREMTPWMMIPAEVRGQLESTFSGTVSFAAKDTSGTLTAWISTSVSKSQPAGPFDSPVTGTARFVSAKASNGVADIEGDGLVVSGTINLVSDGKGGVTVGDASTGTLTVNGAVSAVVTDDQGKVQGTVIAVCSAVQVTLQKADLTGAVALDPDSVSLDNAPQRWLITLKDAAGAPKTFPATARRAVPFQSMASFTPDGLSDNVPELHRLQVIRELALDLQASLRNNPLFRKAVRASLPTGSDDPQAKAKLKPWSDLQVWAKASFPKLAIKPGTPVAASSTPTDIQRALLTPVGGSVGDLFTSVTATPAAGGAAVTSLVPTALISSLGTDPGAPLMFRDRDPSVADGARLMNSLAAVLVNIDDIDTASSLTGFADLFARIADVTAAVDAQTTRYLDALMHSAEYKTLEANWLGLRDLSFGVTSDDVIIDFLDATKDELARDLQDNALDIFGSALFKKIYVDEYDRYGGHPFATMIGLYAFNSQSDDVDWLRVMMKICAAAHCPFIGGVEPEFFLGRKSMEEVASVTDLDAIVNHPRLAQWNALRDEDWAAYIGLVLPRYLVRLPWDARDVSQSDKNAKSNQIGYVETIFPTRPGDDSMFLWGNAAMLFAKNIVRSYENSGWAQHIRGPLGGGMVTGLTAYTYTGPDGKEDLVAPVEISIPDYREFQFSRNGLISLVHKKGEAVATFFSAQSIKRPKDFEEELNTQNAYLVTNLAYTFSITIIAHYVKVMMREYIGSSADAPYIQQIIAGWLARFVTTVTNPDDLTLLYYPFKATSVVVEPKPGPLGWYMATISILPHVQFEGMDVELRLEAALGGKA